MKAPRGAKHYGPAISTQDEAKAPSQNTPGLVDHPIVPELGRSYHPDQTFSCVCGEPLVANLLVGSDWCDLWLICRTCNSAFAFRQDGTLVKGVHTPVKMVHYERWTKEGLERA